MSALPNINDAVPHVLDEPHAQPNGKNGHIMPPRREPPPLRDDSSREILAAIHDVAESIKESKPKSNGVPIAYVLTVLVPLILAAMWLADMNATQRAQAVAIKRIEDDRELLITDVDMLLAYINDTRLKLGQRGFMLPEPPALKSKRKSKGDN